MRTPLPRLLLPMLALALAACGDTTQLMQPEEGIDTPVPSYTVNSGADALILSPTIWNGVNSPEALALASLGKTFDIATPAEWLTLTATNFAAYGVIILGDPHCRGGTTSVAAATANASTWGPVVDGNVIIIGTDPVYHRSRPGAAAVTQKGIEFAVDAAGRTGAYITTSCYYHGTPAYTPVTFLDGLSTLGNFTATKVPGCYDDAYKTASHPALAGITSAGLSGWGCSVHNGFDTWPADFEVLAIGRNVGAYYTAPDGTKGVPYILARGEGLVVISDIALTPASATAEVGNTHTVTANVTADGSPDVGRTVTFTVVDGPHTGTTGSSATDAAGNASFSYVGATPGTDGIRATFVTDASVTQTSSRVTMEWTEVLNTPPTADAGSAQTVTRTSPAGADVDLDGSASSDSDGTIVDYDWLSDTGASASGSNPTVSLGLGVHTFTLTVTDDYGATDTDEVVITVVNAVPTADAGAGQTVECTDCSDGGTSVSLDGSGSSDVDGTIVDYAWAVGGTAIGSGATPDVTLTFGTHTVTLTVTDNDGATASSDVEIVIEDNTAPEVTFALTTTELWSPNHKMVTVATGITVFDACDSGVALDALSFMVESNEPINGLGDGNTDPDWIVTQDSDGTWSLQVRAERAGNGTGRIYSISVTATDGSSNTTVATGEVTVPHSQGKGKGKG